MQHAYRAGPVVLFGHRRTMTAALLVGWALLGSPVARAYSEFQQCSQKHSGQPVSCAMCHANADGPVGLKPGQISSLNSTEQARLVMARAAFMPGQKVDSPILNRFGNHIIALLGKNKFIELRADPKQLAGALGDASDLDGDGASDAAEFLAGTDPLNPHHGPPLTLLLHNLRSCWLQVALLVLATLLGLYGLRNLLHSFAQQAADETPGTSGDQS